MTDTRGCFPDSRTTSQILNTKAVLSNNLNSIPKPIMAARKTEGKVATKATATAVRRKASPQISIAKSRGRRRPSVPEGSPQSPAESSIPSRPTWGGKFVAGYTPTGYGLRSRPSKSIEDNADDSEYEDVETGETTFEPALKVEDEDSTPLPVASAAKTKRNGKKVAVKPTRKMVYKKVPRKDSAKFTTTQAMIDAEDEFDPRAAAFRGKAAKGTGNGRQKGRRLVRWTRKCTLHPFVYHIFFVRYLFFQEQKIFLAPFTM